MAEKSFQRALKDKTNTEGEERGEVLPGCHLGDEWHVLTPGSKAGDLFTHLRENHSPHLRQVPALSSVPISEL